MHIKTVSTRSELIAIELLQRENLKKVLSSPEAATEGFLTAEYSVDFLQMMNDVTPSIIAMDENELAGYALATTREVGVQHDLLYELFDVIDRTTYDSKPLKNAAYIVIGQLCVAKKYRGIGLVQKMYNAFRDEYAARFEYCITDIAESNPRSLKAHLKSGFTVIDALRYGGIEWSIVLWDWREREEGRR